MLFAAFGKNIGNLSPTPSPRIPIAERVTLINKQLRHTTPLIEIVNWYRHTGNFIVNTSIDDPDKVARYLLSKTNIQFAVLSIKDLETSKIHLEKIVLPKKKNGIRWTPGMVFCIDKTERFSTISSTSHAEFSVISKSIIGAWKRDYEKSPGKLDPNNRNGGWGALATDVERQLGGIWTARSMSSILGLLKRAK